MRKVTYFTIMHDLAISDRGYSIHFLLCWGNRSGSEELLISAAFVNTFNDSVEVISLFSFFYKMNFTSLCSQFLGVNFQILRISRSDLKPPQSSMYAFLHLVAFSLYPFAKQAIIWHSHDFVSNSSDYQT